MTSSAESSTSRKRKIYVWAAITLIVCIVILLFLFLRHPKNITSPTPSTTNPMPSQIAQTEGHTGNTQIPPEEKTHLAPKDQPRPADEPATLQTPRDAGNSSRPFVENPIRSIELHAMFTYETEKGVALPQGVVPFRPLEDAHAYLEGPDGNVDLDFASVSFEEQDDRHVIVTNIFSIQRRSDLYWKPVENLKNFDFISIPIIVADYESSLKTMVHFYWRLEVNGRYNVGWAYSSDSILAIQDGSTIRIPIAEVAKQKFEKK